MMEYVAEHPDVEYVYQSNNGSLTYISTTRGNLGKFDKRNEYVELLKSCRISLVSTPGMDKSRTDFGNVDFFTPRFFESAAFYCHMLGRYIENKEADFRKKGGVNIFLFLIVVMAVQYIPAFIALFIG